MYQEEVDSGRADILSDSGTGYYAGLTPTAMPMVPRFVNVAAVEAAHQNLAARPSSVPASSHIPRVQHDFDSGSVDIAQGGIDADTNDQGLCLSMVRFLIKNSFFHPPHTHAHAHAPAPIYFACVVATMGLASCSWNQGGRGQVLANDAPRQAVDRCRSQEAFAGGDEAGDRPAPGAVIHWCASTQNLSHQLCSGLCGHRGLPHPGTISGLHPRRETLAK